MATRATQHTKTPRLPGDERIERALLGAALLERGNFYNAAEHLEPRMFYSAAHATIFQAMLDLGQAGVEVNIVTVAEKVDGEAAVEGVGGSPYIAALVDGTPAVADIEHYSSIIRGDAQKRSLAHEGELITERALDPTTTPDELLESIETTIGGIREDQLARTHTAMPIKEAVRETLPSLERSGQGEGAMIGLSTGYPDLDKRIAGWVSGDLVVLAARPSAGKTALALEFARHQAEEGNATLIFSLETNRTSCPRRARQIASGDG